MTDDERNAPEEQEADARELTDDELDDVAGGSVSAAIQNLQP